MRFSNLISLLTAFNCTIAYIDSELGSGYVLGAKAYEQPNRPTLNTIPRATTSRPPQSQRLDHTSSQQDFLLQGDIKEILSQRSIPSEGLAEELLDLYKHAFTTTPLKVHKRGTSSSKACPSGMHCKKGFKTPSGSHCKRSLPSDKLVRELLQLTRRAVRAEAQKVPQNLPA